MDTSWLVTDSMRGGFYLKDMRLRLTTFALSPMTLALLSSSLAYCKFQEVREREDEVQPTGTGTSSLISGRIIDMMLLLSTEWIGWMTMVRVGRVVARLALTDARLTHSPSFLPACAADDDRYSRSTRYLQLFIVAFCLREFAASLCSCCCIDNFFKYEM